MSRTHYIAVGACAFVVIGTDAPTASEMVPKRLERLLVDVGHLKVMAFRPPSQMLNRRKITSNSRATISRLNEMSRESRNIATYKTRLDPFDSPPLEVDLFQLERGTSFAYSRDAAL